MVTISDITSCCYAYVWCPVCPCLLSWMRRYVLLWMHNRTLLCVMCYILICSCMFATDVTARSWSMECGRADLRVGSWRSREG